MRDFALLLSGLEKSAQLRQRRVVRRAPESRPRGAGKSYLSFSSNDYLAFCSNDYLGLASHPVLIEAAQRGAADYGVGGAASHLVCGHGEAHAALEDALAAFVGLPRALGFSTGYMAAVGAVPALAGPGDAVFSDALNHACLIDGIRLSRAAVHRYPHRDIAALEQALGRCPAAHKVVVSDAVFSMDGDIAPVPELIALCERHDALLLLDDAHGFGVLGEQGRGVLSHFAARSPRIVYMATLGKAAGVAGAFVAGQAEVIEWLMQRARTYVYTTAMPPLLAAANLQSLRLIATGDSRRARLRELIGRLRTALSGLPWPLLPSTTPIQPLVVGDIVETMRLADGLLRLGIWVPAIRPPTVPTGSARLRISLSANHQMADIDRLATALHQLAAQRVQS